MSILLERMAKLEGLIEQVLDIVRQRVPWGWGDVKTAGRLMGIGRETLQELLKEAWEDTGRPARLTNFRFNGIPCRWSKYGPTRPVFQVYLPALNRESD